MEWKDIPGENYQISDEGNIRNKTTKKELKQCLSTTGYKRVSFSRGKGKTPKIGFTHRLVAEAFIPNPENKPFVNHIDGDKQNPHPSNLEWVTNKENVKHAIDTGLFDSKESSVKANAASLLVTSKKVSLINRDNDDILCFKSISECCRFFNMKNTKITNTLEQDKKLKGYEIFKLGKK